MLAKPLTFMNLSGHAVSALAGYYQVEPADVLALTDDVALPLGRLRARREGGAGGHNGLKSVIEQLGTQSFPRCGSGWGAATTAATSPTTCSAGSRPTSATQFRRRCCGPPMPRRCFFGTASNA